MNDTTLKAYQGQDTKDLLNHIAWTDVVKPQLDKARTILTKLLVEMVLTAPKPGSETREQVAGKLYGLDFIEKALERILREGNMAQATLADQNLFLQ